jgi:hypothetical protein
VSDSVLKKALHFGGLVEVALEECNHVKNDTLLELFQKSSKTLKVLNVNRMYYLGANGMP